MAPTSPACNYEVGRRGIGSVPEARCLSAAMTVRDALGQSARPHAMHDAPSRQSGGKSGGQSGSRRCIRHDQIAIECAEDLGSLQHMSQGAATGRSTQQL
jgi:hypothetical protein